MIDCLSRLFGIALFLGMTGALAQAEPEQPLRIGARLGYAAPFGDT